MLGLFFVVLDQNRLPSLQRIVTFRPWLFLAALSFGAAAATKWSGLYFLAAFGLYSFVSDLLRRSSAGLSSWPAILQGAINAVTMVIAALGVYLTSWLGWITTEDGWGRKAKPSWFEALWEYHLNSYRFHT